MRYVGVYINEYLVLLLLSGTQTGGWTDEAECIEDDHGSERR